MGHVFISYAKLDTRQVAEELFNRINAISGFTAWMDKSLEAAESWAFQIQDEIDKADVVIVLISPDVNRRPTKQQRRSFVLNEIDYAQQDNKQIIPIMAIPTKMPVQLAGVQYLDFSQNQAQEIQKLFQILENIAPEKQIDDEATQPQSPFELAKSVDFLQLIGVSSVSKLDIRNRWQRSLQPQYIDWIRTPIGIDATGKVRELYFKADADGTHALISGVTGSGKSEFLTTLLTSLAINYDPQRVRFVLIDFKGSSTFEEFLNFPHTADILITHFPRNIRSELEALGDEMINRSWLLANNNSKDIVEYWQRGYARTNAPFPHLFVVIDEFTEMVNENEEVLRLIENISRLGRAIGVNLILASQHLPKSEQITQLLANAKLRIALRTDSLEDSQTLIGSEAALQIPPSIPGRAFMKIGDDALEMLQLAYSSPHLGGDWRDILEAPTGEFIDKWILELHRQYGFYDIRLDWLRSFVTLEDLSTQFAENLNNLKENLPLEFSSQSLKLKLGMVEAILQPFELDLQNNHLLILGEAQSGKTTTLQSIALASVLAFPPKKLNLHIFAALDQKLHRIIGKLPHVKTLVDSRDTQKVEAALNSLEKRLDTMGEWDDAKDIVLIDELTTLFEQSPKAEVQLAKILRGGWTMDVHIVATDTSPDRWEDLYNLFTERIVLRLPQPVDYVFALGNELKASSIQGRGHILHEGTIRKVQLAAPHPEYRYGDAKGDAALARLVMQLKRS